MNEHYNIILDRLRPHDYIIIGLIILLCFVIKIIIKKYKKKNHSDSINKEDE